MKPEVEGVREPVTGGDGLRGQQSLGNREGSHSYGTVLGTHPTSNVRGEGH